MRIIIGIDFDDDLCDGLDPSGVTDEGFDEIESALGHLGTDITVSRAATHVINLPSITVHSDGTVTRGDT